MKIGDLIKVKKCSNRQDCECFFCYHKSSCIGLVVAEEEDNLPFRWVVKFDCGEWELSSAEGKVISENEQDPREAYNIQRMNTTCQ